MTLADERQASSLAWPYRGALVAFGTMHGKERQFAPAFARCLGAEVHAADGIDTDALGTFTGETPRTLAPADAALAKAEAAADALGTAFALATEASYGSSSGGFGPAVHEEVVVFVDGVRGLRVIERMRRTVAIPPPRHVDDDRMARAYLERLGFPQQAVVLRWPDGRLEKGVDDWARVASAVRGGGATLEPDLRAHVNPDRRRALRRLAWTLAMRLRRPCPACDAPGFGAVDVVSGVPCGDCARPTRGIRFDVHGCGACGYRVRFERERRWADPATCDSCNP